MEVIYGAEKKHIIDFHTGVGLGNFDGLHIGHMALINTLISESKLNGLKSLVYTFTKHPENILRKKLFTPLLTTVSKKIELLEETSLKYLYFDEFNESYSRMKPEAFVKDILVDKLKVRIAVAGFDYRFGFKGEGDVELLQKLANKYKLRVVVIPPIKIDDEIVGSTMIRQSVAKGDMNRVFKFLGRHYSITGDVKSGKRIGNKIGFPTANIHPEDYLILPQYGVYITKTLLDGQLYTSVTNIGVNPTVDGSGKICIETHILDFDRDIYGKRIEVFFIRKVRGEKKFIDKDGLALQIQKDVMKAREYFDLTGEYR